MTAWRLSMDIAVQLFKFTNELHKKEDYGLTCQIRRAANSVPANIAKAFGRTGSPDKKKFYNYARGSSYETNSHLIYGVEVGYLNSEEATKLRQSIERVIQEINKTKTSLS